VLNESSKLRVSTSIGCLSWASTIVLATIQATMKELKLECAWIL